MRFSEFFGCEWVDLGGGRFRGGLFDRGDLKFMILKVIAGRPMHGYEVMRALEEESRGCYRASPGSVYPTLQMLEDEGFLTSEKQDGKRVYSVTPEGEAYLAEHEEKVKKIDERIREATEKFFGQDMKNLVDSFSKLAEETFEGAFKWTEDADFMGHVKEILDSASERIEEARGAAREARRAARDASRAAREAAREAARGAKEAAWEAAREAQQAAQRARDAAREAAEARRAAASEQGTPPEEEGAPA
ncbi:MAG: PadR family transcriptional regulator [Gemmatimonadota bacterium]